MFGIVGLGESHYEALMIEDTGMVDDERVVVELVE